MAATIYYDGECPFCTRYVGLVKLREAVGPVKLVNLRDDVVIRNELAAEGFDLDQGMVVDVDGNRVGGAQATNMLADMSTPSGTFNRLNRAIFGMPVLSGLIYPVLRTGRWLSLFLMGRRTINDATGEQASRQTLFGLLFAMFSLFHVFNYLFEYAVAPLQLDLLGIFVAALVLLLRPGSTRALFFLVLISTISTVIQAPIQSNHTMLRSMVLIGYWLSFFNAAIRAQPVSEIFANFILAGRGSLLVMYFYGIFHKINTEFLNPETSCAASLWDEMLPPISWVQSVFVDYAAIYGTFIVEGAMVLALLNPRTRHWGMVGGICFHMFLALSNFAAYVSFTTLAISLHILFLSGSQIDRIMSGPDLKWLKTRARQPVNKLSFLILLFVGGYAMSNGHYSVGSLCLLPIVFTVCVLIIRHGHEIKGDESRSHSKAAYVIGTFVTALYFLNGALPYLGLKTAQTVAMFSNLQLEGGASNHLVFPNAPGPFTYLDDVAIITDPHDDPIIGGYHVVDYRMVYYDLLARLVAAPDARVSFTMNGQSYENVGAADLSDDINQTLHSPFVRKWFHFRPVVFHQPETCL